MPRCPEFKRTTIQMKPTRIFHSLIKTLPGIRNLVAERDALVKSHGFVPPGHYYSPIVSLEEVANDEAKIFGETPRAIPGVELNESEQLDLLKQFEPYYESMPFNAHKTSGMRYYFENPAYSYSDAILLYCMIRHLQPRKIVEIGSGFSSCASLDTNQLFLNNSVEMTFIEPFPELLLSLITPEDVRRITIIPHRLQDVPMEHFNRLEKNDILFVDSTHVSKVNSDVNRLFFEILPSLRSGVYIHIHDVFFPFEYPKEWIFAGRSWNELYLLRAFLQYNNAFRIVLMNTFLERFHEDIFRGTFPLCLENRGGSIWIRKE